jgi:FG-GAP repeat
VASGAPLIGVAAGDYDNDGYEDLYVTANGGNRQGPTDADDPRACQPRLLADLCKNCPNSLKWRSIMIQGELSQCAKRVEAAL